jgi:CelD/BcsL family acetyltransferase involved in cellulose biosynthesis
MTLAELMNVIRVYPDRIILFGAYDRQDLAAASISIRVSKRIVYNFYSAHPRKYDFLSPVVMLMQGMYGWSQKHDVGLIDLGTSFLDGQPNYGLLDFKLRLSGIPSTKLTFEKDLL